MFYHLPGSPHPHQIPSASVYPPRSKLPQVQQFIPSYVNTHFPFPSPASAPGSPSPLSSSPVPDVFQTSPAHLWPPHSQPLFSLAHVMSMAMSMAQSFMPAPGLVQAGYPVLYTPQYPPEYHQSVDSQHRDAVMSAASRASAGQQTAAAASSQEGTPFSKEYPHGYRAAFPRHLLEQHSSPGSSSGQSSSSRASPDSRVSLIH